MYMCNAMHMYKIVGDPISITHCLTFGVYIRAVFGTKAKRKQDSPRALHVHVDHLIFFIIANWMVESTIVPRQVPS